jgi:hypothetical protein
MMLLRRLPISPTGWLVYIGLIVVFCLVAWFLATRRRQGLERVAREMGFSFHPKATTLGSAPYLRLPLLKQSTDLSNALVGSVATGEAVLLDCQIGTGKSSHTVTVACLRLAGKQLPAFQMRPESIFHKIGSAFGYQDIDFSENETFSKSYLLRGEDEAAVRGLFHPGRLAFFEQHKDWVVEGAGEWLAIHKQWTAIGPSKMRGFVEEVTQVATAFS